MSIEVHWAENLADSTWNDTLLCFILLLQTVRSHRIGLSAASLPIGEYANIVAIQKACNQVLHLFVDLGLITFFAENLIEYEAVLILLSLPLLPKFHLDLLRIRNDKFSLYQVERFPRPWVRLEIRR